MKTSQPLDNNNQYLLQNAIFSIQAGFEDYFANDEKRYNTAIRNIYCGILLLLKAKINEFSPSDSNDVLIKKKIEFEMKNGKPHAIGKGVPTISYDEIIERLKQLETPLDKDMENIFKELKGIRNDIEHHFTDHTAEKLKVAVLESFLLINQLQKKYFKELDPKDICGEKYKDLVNEDKEHTELRYTCIKEWKSYEIERDSPLECLFCKSDLTKPSKNNTRSPSIYCLNCNKEVTLLEVIDFLCKSNCFADTHRYISYLSHFISLLSDKKKKKILKASENNSQIYRIKDDEDVADFLDKIQST